MKITNIAAVLLVSFIRSCAPMATTTSTEIPISATVIPMADNFSFIFTDYSCGIHPFDVLDTNSGVLIHTPLDETESITIPFQLTNSELEEIFHKIAAMDFFNFPSDFAIPDEYAVATEAPTSSYELSATNGAMVNRISWTTGGFTDSGYTKADQLKELIRHIQKMIRDNSEYQKLPEASVGCA